MFSARGVIDGCIIIVCVNVSYQITWHAMSCWCRRHLGIGWAPCLRPIWINPKSRCGRDREEQFFQYQIAFRSLMVIASLLLHCHLQLPCLGLLNTYIRSHLARVSSATTLWRRDCICGVVSLSSHRWRRRQAMSPVATGSRRSSLDSAPIPPCTS
jgi:hypothetical protein